MSASPAGIIEELAATLGLETDAASFFKANALLHMVETALETIKEVVSETIKELANLPDETAKFAKEAELAAQRTNTTVDAFQELQFAAKASEIEVGTLENGLKFLSRTAFEATQGNDELAAAFKTLGVPLKDAEGKLRPVDELFGDVAEGLSELKGKPEQVGLALKVLSRSGNEMLPFLNKGKEGIAALREEAHEFGAVLDGPTREAAARFRKNNRELNESIEGLKNALGGELLKAMGNWKSAVAGVINEIRPYVVTALGYAIKTLTALARGLLPPLRLIWSLFKLIGDVALWLTKTVFGGLAWILKSLDDLFGGLGTVAVDAAIAAGLAWLAAAAPVVLIAGLIAGLLLVLEDVQTFFEGGDSYTGDFVNAIKAALPKVTQFFKDQWDLIKDYWVQGAKNVANSIAQFFIDQFHTVIDFWKGALSSIPGLGKLFSSDAATASSSSTPVSQVAASVANNNSKESSSFQVQQTINVGPTASPAEIGRTSADYLGEWHDGLMRDAYAGVGG